MEREAVMLLRYLDANRRHVLAAIDGLSDDQLLRPVLPSGWTCIGMVKHLALADEHYWFRVVMGGEPADYFPEGPLAEWQLEPGETPADVVELYLEEIRRSNAIMARTPLDAPPVQPDPMWHEWGMDFPDFRFIVLHMLTETATHAGHLDAAREMIDGKQWMVL